MRLTFPKSSTPTSARAAVPALFCALFLLLLSACNLHFDVDSVEQPTEQTHDAGDLPELGPELEDCTADGTLDCFGTCRDTLTDPWNCGGCNITCEGFESCIDGQCLGTYCPELEGRPATCNPIQQAGGCNFNDQSCTLRLAFENGLPSHFAVECRTRPFSQTPVDSPCTQDDECTDGSYCTSWEKPDPRGRVCSKFCDLASGEGCSYNEFCTNPYPDLLEGIGFCTPRCDPLDARSCPQGTACTPDFDHGTNSCHANFRCLQNGNATDKSAGSSCNPYALHQDGCPAGLVCIDNQCTQPCATTDDCADGFACRQAHAPWSSTRFCQQE